MRKIIYILALIICYPAYGQSLSVFDIDPLGFPTIRAKFFAFDTIGNQITILSSSDFEVKENGQVRKVTLVSCPSRSQIPLSSVLVMDVSGSMCDDRLEIAKAAANAWITTLPLNNSECAITSFSDNNYVNQDFSSDKTKLINGINSLECKSGTNYNAALLDPAAGGILIAKTGKYKRVIVFLTDGGPNFPPNTAQIISQALENDIAIYSVTIAMPAPQCMKDFANQTGGLFFEYIRTKEEAEECYRKIFVIAQGGGPCLIEWQSELSCLAGIKNVDVKLLPINKTVQTSYLLPKNSVASLEFNPASIKFINIIPGIKKDTIISITARNSNFKVTNIKSSNTAFMITPASFTLTSGQSTNLTVSYVPADSGYTITIYTIENDICPAQYFASGGFDGIKPKIKTLKLILPNGGEEFVVGSDTLITWEGVLPEEKVTIDYSINNGTNWIKIADSATGLCYPWHVPKTPSKQCLARVTAKAPYTKICEGGEIQICKQTWMKCNLNVDHYRNGDPIPQVKNAANWIFLKTGAWTYYNNDPAMGAIYGKLYNWYAVNDSRGLAPSGWHIPTDEEWNELEKYLGGDSIAGGKLKEAEFEHWKIPNIGATNESGFSAIPGGWCGANDGTFNLIGISGVWWSATAYPPTLAWTRILLYNSPNLYRNNNFKGFGYSVRCVKN
ncbi:MAG: hypothetical protein HW421_4004 [Ignavibacteria bacterium]|nr:hypothetical protein [Ignavibacteria bacterium]